MTRHKVTKSHAHPHPYEPPFRSNDVPSFNIDELDESSAPPIPGKVHPHHAMDEVVPTLDDSDRVFQHHPNESGSEGLTFDPDSADAAADLAGELGADFVEGATRGRDMSDVMFSEEEDALAETSFIVEPNEEGELPYDIEEEQIDLEMEPLEPEPRPVAKKRSPATR